jgi:hypothetical protein
MNAAQRRWSIEAPYHALMNLDLTDDEASALWRPLRDTIEGDRYPLSPRLAPLLAILDNSIRRSLGRGDRHR